MPKKVEDIEDINAPVSARTNLIADWQEKERQFL